MIRDNEFDIALEWQYGHQDHTVLDQVEKYNKKAREKVIGHMCCARQIAFGSHLAFSSQVIYARQ